jgi:hypothetical protein
MMDQATFAAVFLPWAIIGIPYLIWMIWKDEL